MNDAEKEALRASNGKVWKQDECFQNIAEAKAQKKELDKRSDQLKGEYGNKDRVQADLRELTEKYNTLELQVVKQTHEIEKLEEEMGKRRSKHNDVMGFTKREVCRSFGIISDRHGMPGSLKILLSAKVMK
jgi:predicted RNase H-like nuclease (RuvC/YqgF family)